MTPIKNPEQMSYPAKSGENQYINVIDQGKPHYGHNQKKTVQGKEM